MNRLGVLWLKVRADREGAHDVWQARQRGLVGSGMAAGSEIDIRHGFVAS
jgi:hypothetical protein